jgi:hypothetical protein
VVRQGDEIQGAKISVIKKDGIEVVHNDKTYSVAISESISDNKNPLKVNRNPPSGARRK